MEGAAVHGASVARIAEILRRETGRDDREVWVTEYSLFFGVAGLGIHRVQDFLAAPMLARYTIEHVRAGVALLQQWSLVGDWYFGMLHDAVALGRRATGEVFPLLAQVLRGDLVGTTVAGPSFIGPAAAGTLLDGAAVPWLDAVATRDGGTLRVLLVNGHPAATMAAKVTVAGASMSGDATVTTVSSAGCDTVDVNPPEEAYTFAPGVVGEAVRLDATIPLHHPLEGRISPEEGTVELWLDPDWDGGDAVAHAVLSLGLLFELGVDEDGLLLVRIASELADTLDWAVADTRGWRAGAWHHVAVTWNADAVRLYVDGAEAWETPRAAKWTWVDPGRGLVLGAAVLSPGAGLDGWVDELRIDRRARTAAEISADVQQGRAGEALAVDADTGLLLHLDRSLADEVRDERTIVATRTVPVSGGALRVEVPPCGVALGEIGVPSATPGRARRRKLGH